MKAVLIVCTLKKSPAKSNTEFLAKFLASQLEKREVETELIRAVDYDILPGVSSDEGPDDDWPSIKRKILKAQIVVLASPTWVGRTSSVAQRVIERLDAFIFEKDDNGYPLAYNRVAGFVATGTEDGAKHVIAEMEAAFLEIGFTVPGAAWAYFNNGSASGPTMREAGPIKRQSSLKMAVTAASNLVGVAKALEQQPVPPPPKLD